MEEILKMAKKLGLQLSKPQENIGFLIEKANVYYYRIGGEVGKSLL